ncbi:unnamed protein product, partial [Dibothriocephalus latus]
MNKFNFCLTTFSSPRLGCYVENLCREFSLVQVDGSISSFVCTVLDGHSGTACSHALAWVALD